MFVKYNVARALAKLINMCSGLDFDQGVVWKYKFDQVDFLEIIDLIASHISIRIRFRNSATSPESIDFDLMFVKYNVVMAIAKLANMCSTLSLGQGGVYKSKCNEQYSAAELSYKYYYKNKVSKFGFERTY